LESDYLKLSEQYASFLAAIGGVSITVLTLVLSLGPGRAKAGADSEPVAGDSRTFLVAALVVATVSCFIGTHMMAETAAFISHSRMMATIEHPALSGDRLFLLASANIFIAIILVLFAVMLLLTTSGRVDVSSIKPIAVSVFGLVVIGAVIWVVLAARHRMRAPSGWRAVVPSLVIGVLWGLVLYFFLVSKRCLRWKAFKYIAVKFTFARKLAYDEKVRDKCLLWVVFIPCIIFTVGLFLRFAWTFNDGGSVHDQDVCYFTLAIIFSYVSLVVAGIKTTLLTRVQI
jgi:hypothetical protein